MTDSQSKCQKMVDAIEANTHLWPWRCVHRKLGWTTARRLWCPGAGCGMLRVFQWGFRLSHLQIWINWRRKELSWNMNPFAGCVWANPFAGLARWCTLWRQASCSILFFLRWEVNSRRVERRQSTWLGKARESGHGNREGMQNRKQINVENPSKSSNPFTISYQLFSSNFINFLLRLFSFTGSCMQMETFTRVNGHLILPTGWGPKFVFVSFQIATCYVDLRKGTYHHSDGWKTQRFRICNKFTYFMYKNDFKWY